jgi:multidrug efflux pump subunit AcrB
VRFAFSWASAADPTCLAGIDKNLQQYHVILEVNPKFQFGPEALNGIYVKSSSGQQVPISTLVDSVVKVAPLVINHQGQFPSVTISFNLAPGAAIGDAVSAIQRVEKELGAPLSLQTSFQGNAQAFGASLSSTPILIAASLFVIYLILGILYEGVIHPITIISPLPSAGIGALAKWNCAAAAANNWRHDLKIGGKRTPQANPDWAFMPRGFWPNGDKKAV